MDNPKAKFVKIPRAEAFRLMQHMEEHRSILEPLSNEDGLKHLAAAGFQIPPTSYPGLRRDLGWKKRTSLSDSKPAPKYQELLNRITRLENRVEEFIRKFGEE